MFFDVHTHHFRSDTAIFNGGYSMVAPEGWHSRGIHPFDPVDAVLNPDFMKAPKCLAVGECGLDKLSSIAWHEQVKRFELQIELSELHQLPLILHCVKSWNEVLAIRRCFAPKQNWIFHGFRKTKLADAVLKEGIYLGIGSAVLFDQNLRDLIVNLPTKHFLAETDDQTEVDIEGVYHELASLKNMTKEVFQFQMHANFAAIFKKWIIGSNAPNC